MEEIEITLHDKVVSKTGEVRFVKETLTLSTEEMRLVKEMLTINEHDLVVATSSNKNMEKGTRGTVVKVNKPFQSYEVEWHLTSYQYKVETCARQEIRNLTEGDINGDSYDY